MRYYPRAFLFCLSASMPTIIYGLKNCDSCKKARKWLVNFAIEHTFIDYREHSLTKETLLMWAEKSGGFTALINKSSTTWRQLPDNLKAASNEEEWAQLLGHYPQLIHRPLVVMDEGVIHQGFSDNNFRKLFAINA